MSNDRQMTVLSGLAVSRGYASGPVFVYRAVGEIPTPEYVVEPARVDAEIIRFHHALSDVKRDIASLVAALRLRSDGADVHVFECHAMLVEDPLLVAESERYIREDRVNAELAVRRTARNARAQFGRMNDPYLRERVRDLDDVERRLLKALTGFSDDAAMELRKPSIVVADELTPSETVKLPRDMVLGFATNGGSTTSHVALLARALGIPAVAGLGDVTAHVRPGDTVLLDGTNGRVTIGPDKAAESAFSDLIERQKELVELASIGHPAGCLKGGGEVVLCANCHSGVELAGLGSFGARGIGLYRSEYLWIGQNAEPTEEVQFAAYREVAEVASALSATPEAVIRLLDIGGDKLVSGQTAQEANPFLGNRSIRYLLSHREILRTQLRAALRASAFGRCAIMYPMVSCVDELRACAEELAAVKRGLDRDGTPYDAAIRVGAMIEVPSAAINARALAEFVDFFSIGTNDLVQYTMAADRGNDAVAHLYQPLNPAVISLVKMTLAAAAGKGIPVAVCGESAADPLVGVYWAALGVGILSMGANYIPVISKVLARLTRADLDEYATIPDSLGAGASADEILAACRAWMIGKIPDFESIVI